MHASPICGGIRLPPSSPSSGTPTGVDKPLVQGTAAAGVGKRGVSAFAAIWQLAFCLPSPPALNPHIFVSSDVIAAVDVAAAATVAADDDDDDDVDSPRSRQKVETMAPCRPRGNQRKRGERED